jgi:predicted DNA-binding transcriptional regulator YafY
MNRIDRLHAILTHLQSKKKVTAQEMADRFNISLRTVYRDVKALDESGVPVIGEAGSGYTIMEGYRLPPVMFTQEEASALLLGAKLAEQFTDGTVRRHFHAALFKIKAVLRSPDIHLTATHPSNIYPCFNRLSSTGRSSRYTTGPI